MLEWEGLEEEIKKARAERGRGISFDKTIREVLPSALEKVDKQLKLLTDKVNELSEGT